MAGKKSKQFVIATEGATVDGRTIDRAWIAQMASNYDTSKYHACVNLEHVRGYDPKGLFRNYGFVETLATQETPTGKLQLLATITPTEDLVAMVKAKQKVFTSIEVNPKFADTGSAYLMGVAVTDTPASLGTAMLEFTAQNPEGSPLTARKQQPENHFSVGVETTIEFEDVLEQSPSLPERIRAIFNRRDRADAERFAGVEEAIAEVAEHGRAQSTASSRQFDMVDGEMRRLSTASDGFAGRLAALEQHLNTTPAPTVTRPRADGGAQHQTDF